MRTLAALTPISLALLASCSSLSYVEVSDRDFDGALLAASTDPDGTERRWQAYPGRRGQPRIERTVVASSTIPKIGVTSRTLDRARADALGVEPWQGVELTKVFEGLPADRAGLVRGDIVLAVEGEPVSSTEQFTDLLRTRAEPDRPLKLTVRVRRRAGDAFDADASADLSVTPIGERVRDASTDSIEIESSKGVQAFTGLQAAELSPDLLNEIFGGAGSPVLITGVVAGSPAYLAGLRSGDRLVSVDGVAADSLDTLRDAVLQRVRANDPTATAFDLTAGRSRPLPAATTDAPIVVEVDGALGPHRAELEIRDDIDERTSFYIPIVTHYETAVNETDWDFLDFILQFGFSYEGRYLPSPTRSARRTSRFSLFPFGMFEVEHRPSKSEYTFFWFIDFEVDR